MTKEKLLTEINFALLTKPSYIRDGQFVFNYIDKVYNVERHVQFKDGVDCFHRDDKINEFIEKCVNQINKQNAGN